MLNINHFRSVFPQIVLITCGITGVEIDGELRIMDFSPLKNINLAKEIRDSTQIETIIENDINAATLGYALEDNEVLSGVYFPEKFPPGSSLIINQTIFKGSNNISGEIKYLPTFRTAEFPLSQNEIYLKVFDSIQTIIAMYAPHQLIIFIPQVWEKLLNIEK
ncbi:ROK family protein [Lactococcus lactis]